MPPWVAWIPQWGGDLVGGEREAAACTGCSLPLKEACGSQVTSHPSLLLLWASLSELLP